MPQAFDAVLSANPQILVGSAVLAVFLLSSAAFAMVLRVRNGPRARLRRRVATIVGSARAMQDAARVEAQRVGKGAADIDPDLPVAIAGHAHPVPGEGRGNRRHRGNAILPRCAGGGAMF